jgi:hypothetical protein
VSSTRHAVQSASTGPERLQRGHHVHRRGRRHLRRPLRGPVAGRRAPPAQAVIPAPMRPIPPLPGRVVVPHAPTLRPDTARGPTRSTPRRTRSRTPGG